MDEIFGKRVAVIGLARAGVPAARFLAERGAVVRGLDSKPREALSREALALEPIGVELVLEGRGLDALGDCDLVVLSPGLKIHHEPLQSALASAEAAGTAVIGELELAWRFCPCPLICVTGTKGKSTTVKLIVEMLLACGVNAVAAGNTGTPLIGVLPQLARESWAVVEVSSFQLEKAPTLRPRIAVLVSLLEDHQDYHPTLDQYWETKLRLFAGQGEGDCAVINQDDVRVRALARGHYIGAQVRLDVSGANQRRDGGEGAHWHDDVLYVGSIPLVRWEEVPLRGQHNRANLTAALQAVLCTGVVHDEATAAKLAPAIRNFKTLPHRLEEVARHDGVTWINDSQSTIPDAAIAALRAFAQPVTLIAGGRSKLDAADAFDGLALAVAEKRARLVLIGEAAEALAGAARKNGVPESQIFIARSLPTAVHIAKMESSPGETVVLSPACASFDQFSSYEERGAVFRREVAQANQQSQAFG